MSARPARRRLLQALAGVPLVLLGGGAARAHEFPEPGFTIIHPWVPEAPRGTSRLVVSMRIIQISDDDRLLSAHTPVGRALDLHVPARPHALAPAASGPAPAEPGGIALQRGRELSLSPFGPHLVLRDVNTELRFGFEYPLTLRFEKAGHVEAALIVGTH